MMTTKDAMARVAQAFGVAERPEPQTREDQAHHFIYESLIEIHKLSQATSKLFDGHEDGPMIHGLMSRIAVLTDVLFYAQLILRPDESEDRTEEIDIGKLEAAFEGRFYA
jgi:hypothetical protein